MMHAEVLPSDTPARAMRPRRKKGFSLLEMMVAIFVAGMLIMSLSQALAPALAFYGKQDTDARLRDLRVALEQAYKDDAQRVDSVANAVFTTRNGVINPVLPDPNGRCDTPVTTFDPIARYLPTSAAASASDGFGQGVCVLISPRATWSHEGVEFQYHAIAVVSAGFDGAVDPGTDLSPDGVLVIGGDDKGFVVDGRAIVGGQIDEARRQLERAASSLESYFFTRYQSNPSRDMGIYYFANRNQANAISSTFDVGGIVSNTRGVARPITEFDNHTQIGLSVDDVTDPWGGVMLFDNSSNAVRHPQNANAGARTPPFTSRVSIQLPNGALLERTIVGTY